MSNIWNEFYKLFEIKKIDYKEPGRVVDDNGDICEWYIDKGYPDIEPIFFDLLNIYRVQYSGKEVYGAYTESNLKKGLMQCLVDLYQISDDSIKEELKKDIQFEFEDYYGEAYKA